MRSSGSADLAGRYELDVGDESSSRVDVSLDIVRFGTTAFDRDGLVRPVARLGAVDENRGCGQQDIASA